MGLKQNAWDTIRAKLKEQAGQCVDLGSRRSTGPNSPVLMGPAHPAARTRLFCWVLGRCSVHDTAAVARSPPTEAGAAPPSAATTGELAEELLVERDSSPLVGVPLGGESEGRRDRVVDAWVRCGRLVGTLFGISRGCETEMMDPERLLGWAFL